jgi:threonine dehydrogenase-like Zn-dependent dehydrogenase
MKAMALRSGELRIDTFPDPIPENGQVIVKSLACCICASDLHMVHHANRLSEWSAEHNGPFNFDPDRDVVLGHEFCGEIVELGPKTTGTHAVGDRVVSSPIVFTNSGFAVLGYSNDYYGAFGEYLALSESLLLPVANHLPTSIASLMEPLSVGVQYARIANVANGEVPLVIGCGAIGLAVIAAMHAKGIAPIVAADFSPLRREMAVAMGATDVVDPYEEDPVTRWSQCVPNGAGCVIIECVGAPGVLGELFNKAPWASRLIVAGQNLEDDIFFTASAHTKGINVQFGGSPIPADYETALQAITKGEIDVSLWQTGHTDLAGAIEAIGDSTDAERHARIAVHPHGFSE